MLIEGYNVFDACRKCANFRKSDAYGGEYGLACRAGHDQAGFVSRNHSTLVNTYDCPDFMESDNG